MNKGKLFIIVGVFLILISLTMTFYKLDIPFLCINAYLSERNPNSLQYLFAHIKIIHNLFFHYSIPLSFFMRGRSIERPIYVLTV